MEAAGAGTGAGATGGGTQPLAAVRESTERVVSTAGHVHIDAEALQALARELLPRLVSGREGDGDCDGVAWDAEGWHYNADAATDGPLTAQYVLVLDALNWCFWPSEQGLEYEHLARGIKKALERDPSALDADRLATISPEVVATWLDPPSLAFPQLAERTRKVQEVGRVLGACFQGKAAELVRTAQGSSERLVELVVANFPGFRDEAVYRGEQVFFYKRAQIFAADVWAAYGRRVCTKDSPAAFAFHDVDRLTMFADYRVPQILRARGALVYTPALAAAIDARQELAYGSEEEVEIRAATVQAVEGLREALAGIGRPGVPSVVLDWLLWQEGENQRETLPPHHRTRTVFY